LHVLKLRIENFDQLPDGGPIEFVADRRGFDFGREQHLDWTLPDPSGVISRKHCEVRFFEQAYWLFDLSTNGTFVNKNSKRVQSPHRLSDGDEIRIGDYVISVTLVSSAPSPVVFENAPSSPAHPVQSGNIWDAQDMPPPMDPRELTPVAPEVRRAPDYLRQVVQLPPVVEPSPFIKPAPARHENLPSSDLWGSSQEPAFQSAPPQPPPPTPRQAIPVATPDLGEIAELPFQPSAPMYRDEQQPAAPRQQMQAVHGNQDLLERFASAAGLPPDTFKGRDEGEVIEEVGKLLNLFCAHFMELLNARAAAKTLSRSGSRTLIQARNNNPLKFMPTPEDALRVMLSTPTSSYMVGDKAVQSSFEDIRSHQLATLSAMQRAVSDLVEEFSPNAIKAQADGTKKSLLGTGKSKYWESFVERWDARTAGKEFGMLSVFFDAFAQYYDKETNSKS
jgi:type VI secretion system protein ImpI